MKKLVFLLAGVLILLFGIYFFQTLSSYKYDLTSNKKVRVYQRIFENKKDISKQKSYELEQGKSALDLLQQTVSVTIKGSGQNAFVTTINGIEGSEKNKKYWALYVNGKIAEVGAGSYILKNNDKIEWKLENY